MIDPIDQDPRDCPPFPNSEVLAMVEWESRALTGNSLNQGFILQQIRKYNQTSRQLHQDKALSAIGIHTGLLPKRVAIAPELTQEERNRVLYFCTQFLKTAGIKAEMKQQKAP